MFLYVRKNEDQARYSVLSDAVGNPVSVDDKLIDMFVSPAMDERKPTPEPNLDMLVVDYNNPLAQVTERGALSVLDYINQSEKMYARMEEMETIPLTRGIVHNRCVYRVYAHRPVTDPTAAGIMIGKIEVVTNHDLMRFSHHSMRAVLWPHPTSPSIEQYTDPVLDTGIVLGWNQMVVGLSMFMVKTMAILETRHANVPRS